jgi:NADH-quinone oxidoreductase subunit N
MSQGLDALAVAPTIAVVGAVVALLMVDVTWKPGPRAWAWLAAAGVVAATGLAALQWAEHRDAPEVFFSGMLAVDGFSALAGLVVYPLTGLGLLAGWRLVESLRRRGAEFVALVLLAGAGAHLMASSANLVMLFISLEVFSISLYVLAGFTRERVDADEAALKYFLLGAFASAVFLYGVALVFAATGSTSIYGDPGSFAADLPAAVLPDQGIRLFLESTVIFRPGILLAGTAMIIVGLGFKVSAAPFHVWSPDVYQGAPGGITGFLAAAAKVAGFAALARVLTVALGPYLPDWAPAVAGLSVLSVVVGTLLAIAQSDIKRMLAYSSVAHAGFILTGFVAGADAVPDVWFYVVTYAAQVVGAFTVAAVISGESEGRSPLEAYAGLGRRSPWLAGVLALMMLGMGGIPLTSGFVGKVAVFRAAVDADYLWLVIVALVAAVAGLFFYLRVIVLMYMEAPADAPGTRAATPVAGWGARVTLAVSAAATLVFGVAPWPLLDVLRDALPF